MADQSETIKKLTGRVAAYQSCERHLAFQLERLRLELAAVKDKTWRAGICPDVALWPETVQQFIDTGIMPY